MNSEIKTEQEDVAGGSTEPSSSSQESDQPKAKIARTADHAPRSRPYHNMRIPILRPKLPAKPIGAAVRLITPPSPIAPSSSSNPRPLISLIDQTEFRDRNKVFVSHHNAKPKKPYYTELNEIRKEFGIPESFDSSKPNTISGVTLSDKLQMLQRLRGENKFLRESIEKKDELYLTKTAAIEQIQRSTAETMDHCQLLRNSLTEVQAETNRIQSQMR